MKEEQLRTIADTCEFMYHLSKEIRSTIHDEDYDERAMAFQMGSLTRVLQTKAENLHNLYSELKDLGKNESGIAYRNKQ